MKLILGTENFQSACETCGAKLTMAPAANLSHSTIGNMGSHEKPVLLVHFQITNFEKFRSHGGSGHVFEVPVEVKED